MAFNIDRVHGMTLGDVCDRFNVRIWEAAEDAAKSYLHKTFGFSRHCIDLISIAPSLRASEYCEIVVYGGKISDYSPYATMYEVVDGVLSIIAQGRHDSDLAYIDSLPNYSSY